MYNILFLGRGPIAIKCYDLISKYPDFFNIKSIIGDNKLHNKIKYDISFIPNITRNEKQIINIIKFNDINMIISIQHIWILSTDILKLVDYFAFNLHNAKIPEYKGYNTISHAILNNEKEYTTTIHWVVPEVDMGDIAYEESFRILETDTAETVYKKSINVAVLNFQKFINDLINNNEIPRKKITSIGTFYKYNDINNLKEIKDIYDFEEVDTKVRAFDFPNKEPAYYILNNTKFYIKRNYL
jgi:methionyl-tRNA formyltransferase